MKDLDQEKKLLASALRRKYALALDECFSASDPASRPIAAQEEILNDINTIRFRWVIAGNQSGKSSLGAREVAWLFQGSHPKYHPRNHDPLLLIVMGNSMKMVETELWDRKIKPLLHCEYKPYIAGQVLQKVVNKENGNTIIFASHDADEPARQRIQGYVADFVWLDEMPTSARLVAELQRRVQSRDGRFLATFTPTVKSEEVKSMVEAADGDYSKRYRISMFDNPILTEERKKAILSSMEGLPKAMKRTMLYGDWHGGDDLVFHFDPETHCREPEGYDRRWAHILSVDPASAGTTGVSLLAMHPITNMWYLVRSYYVNNVVPSDLVMEIERPLSLHNITKRIADSASSWYIAEASKQNYSYTIPYDKNNRRIDMIKGMQQKMGKQFYVSSECTDFIREINGCSWSTSGDGKIVNSTKYHLLDSTRYAVDSLPKAKPAPAAPLPQEIRIRMEFEKIQERKGKDQLKQLFRKGARWR